MESLLSIIITQSTEWSQIWTGHRRFLTCCWRLIPKTKMVLSRTTSVWPCFGIQHLRTDLSSIVSVSQQSLQRSFSPFQITPSSVGVTMVSFYYGISESSRCRFKGPVFQLMLTSIQSTLCRWLVLNWQTMWLLSRTMVWCVCGISNSSANQSEQIKSWPPDQPESPNPQAWLLLS